MCADPQFLGTTQIGALAVLHTWSRTLKWHPHMQPVVRGADRVVEYLGRYVHRTALSGKG